MKYLQLLKDNGLLTDAGEPIEKVPVKTRGKIKKLLNLNTAIEEEAERIKGIEGKREKASAEEKLQESRDAGQLLDDDICVAIERYLKNKDVYADQGKKLLEARNKKKNGAPVTTDPPAGDPPALDPPASDPPPAPPVVNNDPPAGDPPPAKIKTVAPPKDDKVVEKKKGSGLAWLLGAVAVVACAAVGINIYKNK